jgi:Family of unknown function (DUF6492)
LFKTLTDEETLDSQKSSQVTAPRPLDIVVKTRRKDAETYLQLQTDLVMHSRLGGKVYVIVPREDVSFFSGIIQNDFIVASSEQILELAGYSGEFPDTWSTQQIVKILAAHLVAHDQYLIVDSNTLIGFDFDESFFLRGADYVYAIDEFYDVAWELQTRNFLKLNQAGRIYGFRAVNQIFIKANVRRLINYVEALYQRNVVAILLSYSDEFCTEYWAEYALYGVFVRCILDGTGHYFERRRDVVHFSFREDFSEFLAEVKRERPLMIKFHKRRPRYELTSEEYAKYVAKIKAVYGAPRSGRPKVRSPPL